ncbi:cysteine hydrolase family protein [Companilactobacillus hulinensis]|uniref:cysteine hydrolase family protein n=1 Tax=Companilactobacillus hulinensis TaxID=2486007 RepID=UPI000F780C2F|nr:cysteine hydrolase family protein [Companilactobacillus hulinensis]
MPKLAQVLLVLDMQTAFKYGYNYDGVLKNINSRIEDYRSAKLPIIFVQHDSADLIKDSDLWQFSVGLDKHDDDMTVEKNHPNAFYRTNLDSMLKENDLSTIEVCGVQTEYGCDSTVKMAHGLGYKVYMKHDATTTFDNDYMSAENTIEFYESIWNGTFVTFV